MQLALSFSGGGLRCAAHIGVLKFLQEQGVEVTAVSGSSAGAMVALMVAEGRSVEEMLTFLKGVIKKELFRLGKEEGLFTLKKLEKRFREYLDYTTYKEMQIPLYTCVTDINTGKSHYLNSGDAIANTIASSSLTPLFETKKLHDGKLYIDGGYSDNLPVKPLKALGHKVLAINVNPLTGGNPKGFKSLLIRSLLIILHANVLPSKEITDAYIDIKGVSRMHLFNFKEVDSAFVAGYEEIREHWDVLREKLV
jgi:NTE family protein